MRIVLQHNGTGLYVKEADEMTARAGEAMVFADSFGAAQFCLRHQLAGLNIVMQFDSDGYEIRLEVPVRQGHASLLVPAT